MATLSEVKDWYFDNVHGASEKGYKKLCGAFKYAKSKRQNVRTLQLPLEVKGVVRDYDVKFSFNTEMDRNGKKKPYAIKVGDPSQLREKASRKATGIVFTYIV